MCKPLLELKNVSYSYHSLKGETLALQDLSFHINKGEFVAIAGPSGCGKSTLLSIIFGLLTPEEGSVSFYSQPDAASLSDTIFSNPLPCSAIQCPNMEYGRTDTPPPIGYMLQRDHLFEWRTVYQNALLGLEIAHKLTPKNKEYVLSLMKDYGLYKFKDKRPAELSGGMKQRAALIRTLACNPDLLLLDEPFSALDYQTRLNVSADICNIIRSKKKTALLITHDLSEAISLADRVLVLSRRPAHVKLEIPIHFSCERTSPAQIRSTPEFQEYFNLLWEAMSDEN